MRRFFGVLITLLLLAVLAVPACAENVASLVSAYCTVNADGDCLVSMTVNLHLDSPDNSLMFPLPGTASSITLNGSSVSTVRSGDTIEAALGRAIGGMSGDFSVRFDYTLPKAVAVTPERKLQLTLPLLSGFEYPVQSLEFVITMPGTVTAVPVFTSTYQLNGFESNLELVINSNMITGGTKAVLNDHEAVLMTMMVDQAMFPTVSTYIREGNPEIVPMAVCAGLALLYWLIFLRTLPPFRERSTVPPAGIGAGELNCRIMMTGGDLSMMVFTWAQLGYVTIEMNGGRVRLYKRMDMGNERSLFEVQAFQTLFRNREAVDCASKGYAAMLTKMAAMVPGERTMVRSSSGNRMIYRLLLCLGQVFCGVNLAMNITDIEVLRVLLIIVFGSLNAVSAWFIQDFAFTVRHRYRIRCRAALLLCLFWTLVGLAAGQPWIPLAACIFQLLAGYPAAYGGMRTAVNRSEVSEILGLRRYMRWLPQEEAARLAKADREYFFRMAPYAIALGVGIRFARAFGKKKMVQCPYFITGMRGSRTAEEWMRLMLQAVEHMDYRARRAAIDKWLPVRFR